MNEAHAMHVHDVVDVVHGGAVVQFVQDSDAGTGCRGRCRAERGVMPKMQAGLVFAQSAWLSSCPCHEKQPTSSFVVSRTELLELDMSGWVLVRNPCIHLPGPGQNGHFGHQKDKMTVPIGASALVNGSVGPQQPQQPHLQNMSLEGWTGNAPTICTVEAMTIVVPNIPHQSLSGDIPHRASVFVSLLQQTFAHPN